MHISWNIYNAISNINWLTWRYINQLEFLLYLHIWNIEKKIWLLDSCDCTFVSLSKCPTKKLMQWCDNSSTKPIVHLSIYKGKLTVQNPTYQKIFVWKYSTNSQKPWTPRKFQNGLLWVVVDHGGLHKTNTDPKHVKNH